MSEASSTLKNPNMKIKSFFDEATATVTYLVYDLKSKVAIVIDPVLDYDPASSQYSFESLDQLCSYLNSENLQLKYCFETHAHADHLSGALELKKRLPQITIAIGERIKEVQDVFGKLFHFGSSFKADGSQFDHLLKDEEIIEVGSLKIKTLFTPGHTPACCSFLIEDALFTGDALFMPDTGTGRCDFPKGSSKTLFKSIQKKIFSLPDSTRTFTGHDYKGGGLREARWESTVGEQKKNNIQLNIESTEESYCKMRDARDATLSAPRLLLPSIQINILGGAFPDPEANGMSYIKLPLRPKKQ